MDMPRDIKCASFHSTMLTGQYSCPCRIVDIYPSYRIVPPGHNACLPYRRIKHDLPSDGAGPSPFLQGAVNEPSISCRGDIHTVLFKIEIGYPLTKGLRSPVRTPWIMRSIVGRWLFAWRTSSKDRIAACPHHLG